MIKEAIRQVLDRQSLTPEEATAAMEEIMNGEATPAQIAGFLVALRAKGETVDEISAFAGVMRKHCHRIHPKVRGPLFDTCGTGGDLVKTFNVSTVTAFVVAGAGIPVAKHGGRSVSGICGSADLLQALGVNIEAPPEVVQRSIESAGMGFMFAPTFHPAMKHAAGPRREIGVRTVFNLLGPLTNPAGVRRQVVGVYDPSVAESMAKALQALGSERVMTVHGEGGIDEVSTIGRTRITELRDSRIRTYDVAPSDFGVSQARIEDLLGSTPEENARTTLTLLGSKRPANGAKRDIVLVNAATALVVAGEAENFRGGMELAGKSIDIGAAFKTLKELIKSSGGDSNRIEQFESRT